MNVQKTPNLRAEAPRRLFPNNRYLTQTPRPYDVSSDGRFLMVHQVGNSNRRQVMIGVSQNWLQELKDRLEP